MGDRKEQAPQAQKDSGEAYCAYVFYHGAEGSAYDNAVFMRLDFIIVAKGNPIATPDRDGNHPGLLRGDLLTESRLGYVVNKNV